MVILIYLQLNNTLEHAQIRENNVNQASIFNIFCFARIFFFFSNLPTMHCIYDHISWLYMQVRGVRPLSLLEMANLFSSFRLMVCPGLVSL